MTFLNILEVPALCGQAEPLALWAASYFLENRLGCQEKELTAGTPPTHRGDEPVQRLPSLRVLDRDGA